MMLFLNEASHSVKKKSWPAAQTRGRLSLTQSSQDYFSNLHQAGFFPGTDGLDEIRAC
jgi:hypothetical protein